MLMIIMCTNLLIEALEFWGKDFDPEMTKSLCEFV